MNFFIAMDPPTSTAQMKQVRVVKGKPIFYDPPAVKEARNALLANLAPVNPALTMIILVLFFVAMNVLLFRSFIFKKKNK